MALKIGHMCRLVRSKPKFLDSWESNHLSKAALKRSLNFSIFIDTTGTLILAHCVNSCTINGDNKKSIHNLICNAPIFFYSPFNGSGGFCTTISRKSSSGATRISCFLLLILKYVNSLAGSRSLTMDLALSQRCEISTEYWK